VCFSSASNVTEVLERARCGRSEAMDELINLIYNELRKTARLKKRHERVGHTWQTSDLVHEAFLKLDWEHVVNKAENRKYLFGAAARAMYQLLVNHAKTRDSLSHGGDRKKEPLSDVLDVFGMQGVNFLELSDSIEHLATLNQRQADVIKLRAFSELTNQEIADLLDVSVTTVESDMRLARGFLRGEYTGP